MQKYLGAIDNQTPTQKLKNYKFEEVCTSPAPVVWMEKAQPQWKTLTVRNQDGSGTCVTQTYATEMSMAFYLKYGVWVDFSAAFPYQARGNTSISGCNSTDVYDIFPKIGNVFEHFMPSQNMDDTGVMAVKKESYFDDLAKIWKPSRIELPKDFETVASTIQATGKGVMIWVKFHPEEWTATPTIGSKPTTSGHSITVIDYFLVGGKKYLLILDSWGKNFAYQGYRLISEEYFAQRCFLASYLMTFQVQDNNTTVRPTFKNTVHSAKECLKWEGLFPANVPSNDVSDSIFRACVKKFQIRFNITPTLGNFGPITKAKLTAIYP